MDTGNEAVERQKQLPREMLEKVARMQVTERARSAAVTLVGHALEGLAPQFTLNGPDPEAWVNAAVAAGLSAQKKINEAMRDGA